MAPIPKVVVRPWRTTRELIDIRNQLFKSESEENSGELRSQAISKIQAWRLRGNLPLEISSTAQLVEAQLLHESDQSTDFATRATLSEAFCRFVTAYCDSAQPSTYKQSMSDVANSIGMPQTFITFRHEATHVLLPSRQRLAEMTELAVSWLIDKYWKKLPQDGLDKVSAAKSMTSHEISAPSFNTLVSHDMFREATRLIHARLSEYLARCRSQFDSSITPNTTYDEACELLQICETCYTSLIKEYHINRQTSIPDPLALVLVFKGFLIPDVKKTDKTNPADDFLLWDSLLRRIISKRHAFASSLLQGLVTLIVTPDTHPTRSIEGKVWSRDNPKRRARTVVLQLKAALWIEHLLTDEKWSLCAAQSHIKREVPEAVRMIRVWGGGGSEWEQGLYREVMGYLEQDIDEEMED